MNIRERESKQENKSEFNRKEENQKYPPKLRLKNYKNSPQVAVNFDGTKNGLK